MAALKNSIAVTMGDGGIGSLPLGEDYICGLACQSTTKPSGYSTDSIKLVYTLEQAEALGLTAALFPTIHYQVTEYFRLLDKWGVSGLLYLGFFNIVTANYDGTEIATMQTFAEGKLRFCGVFLNGTWASSDATDANTVAEALNLAGTPLSVFMAGKVSSFSSPVDIRALNVKWVTMVAGMDGDTAGVARKDAAIGAMLAAQAYAKVSENVGAVAKFDLTGGTELQTLALCDGTLVSTLTAAQIDALNDKGWAVIIKRAPSGSYWYDCPTGSLTTSDYNFQERNRVASKAKRLIIDNLSVWQNAQLDVDPTTGFMSYSQITKLLTCCDKVKNLMVNAGEIAGMLFTISPTQNINVTPTVYITCKIVPNGIGKTFNIDLTFTTKI